MPSFKERFRPSRKYKKNKEAGSASLEEPTTASGISTTTTIASTTVDEQTGSVALSNYSVDYCK
jgi:hypothetical protein